ncbi:MAG: hemolysin family protein [Saprospiraceae bacterium]
MTILIIALMLLISAFFSGTEIAYLSADRLRVALKKEQGSKRGQYVVGFFDNPSMFLGTMLVGNNITLVIFGNLMEEALVPILSNNLPAIMTGELGILLSITLVSTLIVLILGEFMPKIIFRLFATNLMLFFTYIHLGIQIILHPLVVLMVKTSEFLLEKLLRINIKADEQVFTRTDLMHFIKSNPTDEIDTEMLEKAMSFKATLVKHCMVKRNEIKAINVTASVETLINTFTSSRFSKIIVYEQNLDKVIGYVHHLPLLRSPKTIRSIIFDIPEIDPNTPVIELMNMFMKAKTSIACVKSYGKTIGIITLEDILEEVFGEIEDEHDEV